MESRKVFLKRVYSIVTLNTLNPITYVGTAKDCFKVRKGLLKENPRLIFKMYEKISIN